MNPDIGLYSAVGSLMVLLCSLLYLQFSSSVNDKNKLFIQILILGVAPLSLVGLGFGMGIVVYSINTVC